MVLYINMCIRCMYVYNDNMCIDGRRYWHLAQDKSCITCTIGNITRLAL